MIHLPLSEAFCFLSVFLTGGLSAAVYAMCRFFRGIYAGKFSTVFFDVIFSASAVVLLFFTIQKACGGNVRFYLIAGFILGFLLVNRIFILLRGIRSNKKLSD